jgi:Flp pilus assembly protein protease CpaA
MQPASFLLQAGAVASLALAAAIDLKMRIIPNWLVLCVIAAGGALRLLADGSAALWSFAIAFAVFVPLAAMTYRGHIGGGDAKMISATILLVEPAQVFALLTAIALAGGVLATLYFFLSITRDTAAKPDRDLAPFALKPASLLPADALPATVAMPVGAVELPYGLAILAGTAFLLLQP